MYLPKVFKKFKRVISNNLNVNQSQYSSFYNDKL